MTSKRPPKKLYPLEEIAAERGWDVSELYDYAKEGILNICKVLNFSDRAIPLTVFEAGMLALHPVRFFIKNDIRRLVITHEEKMRFNNIYPVSERSYCEKQSENQRTVTKKITTEELIPIAQEIQKTEKDLDIVAAKLYDEYGARDHQLVEILNIANHLTPEKSKDPKGSRNRAAQRAVEKGRKTLAARAALK